MTERSDVFTCNYKNKAFLKLLMIVVSRSKQHQVNKNVRYSFYMYITVDETLTSLTWQVPHLPCWQCCTNFFLKQREALLESFLAPGNNTMILTCLRPRQLNPEYRALLTHNATIPSTRSKQTAIICTLVTSEHF